MSIAFKSESVARGTVLLLIAAAFLLDSNGLGVLGMVVMAQRSVFWKPLGEALAALVMYTLLAPIFLPLVIIWIAWEGLASTDAPDTRSLDDPH